MRICWRRRPSCASGRRICRITNGPSSTTPATPWRGSSRARSTTRFWIFCGGTEPRAGLHQEHALAAALTVEQLIGRLGLRQLPTIREQMLDVDLVVGDEARTVGLDGRGECPRADDGELFAQHLRADVDGHVAAFADETDDSPGPRAAHRDQAAVRRAGRVERAVGAGA